MQEKNALRKKNLQCGDFSVLKGAGLRMIVCRVKQKRRRDVGRTDVCFFASALPYLECLSLRVVSPTIITSEVRATIFPDILL